MSDDKKNQPEKKFRIGNMTATIWKNTNQKDGKEIAFYTVSLQRSYKDKDNNWKNTDSMRNNDIPKAVLALNKAYEYLFTAKETGDE